MLLDFLKSNECTSLLEYLVKFKVNGNHLFIKEWITEELNHAFYLSKMQYEWSISLDR